jgi:O-antigen ligase
MLYRKKSIFKLHPLFLSGVIVFSIGGIISSFRSNMPIESLIAVIKYLYLIVVWFWLGTTILRNEKHIYTTILLWSFSAALTSAGAIAQLIWGDIIPWLSPAEGRMTGFTEHVNDLGGVTCVVLIPALSLAFYNNIGYLRKWIHYVIAFFITAGLILSVSISGFIAAIISFLIWGIMDRAPTKKIVMFFIICIVSLSTISISVKHGGISVLDRLTDVSENKLYYETSVSRLEGYHLAWKSIIKSPLVGVGTGPYAGVTETGDPVHNVILLNWYESGVFGLIGIMLILFSLLMLGIYMIKISGSENERILSVSLLASYIAFLVIGVSQPIYFKRFGWISAALIMALYVLRRKSLLAVGSNKL